MLFGISDAELIEFLHEDLTKVFVIFIIGVIAVVLLNVLINVNAETPLIQSDGTEGSSVSASPTLSPGSGIGRSTVSDQNYNCVGVLIRACRAYRDYGHRYQLCEAEPIVAQEVESCLLP